MKKVVIEFINNHWHEVVNLRDDENFTKREILKLVKNDRIYLEWVFGEIMFWGCEIDYLTPFIIQHYDDDEYDVYKIKNKYYKYDHDTQQYEELKMKYINVLCFENLNK